MVKLGNMNENEEDDEEDDVTPESVMEMDKFLRKSLIANLTVQERVALINSLPPEERKAILATILLEEHRAWIASLPIERRLDGLTLEEMIALRDYIKARLHI